MSPAASTTETFSSPERKGLWNRIADYLVHRRVRITVIVFVVLMVQDVLTGVKPHDIFDARDPETLLGCALVFLGLGVRTWSAGILRKTRELTTTGPYAVIRNPLYVGSFLIMSGFCTLIDDVENIFIVLGPVAGLYVLQVLHEERLLSERYGARWAAYASSVPRFLPRSWPRTPLATWELGQWLGSREYQAFSATLLGLLAVQFWRNL